MTVARDLYERAGWDVADVSASQSFDLRCYREGEEIRVEVKGTTSEGWRVLLTPNEVAHARNRYPHVALVVVANIAVDDSETVATGGDVSVYEPWDIGRGELTPVGSLTAYLRSARGRRSMTQT
jgi:hypothetical protein